MEAIIVFIFLSLLIVGVIGLVESLYALIEGVIEFIREQIKKRRRN